ncbi:unnamed protein product [Leptosia nina]|uniref:Uncharacterized protein n=1 Tax=Leptosia nina TaxID=320188 RepID=A0AAV1JE41_9NEOP
MFYLRFTVTLGEIKYWCRTVWYDLIPVLDHAVPARRQQAAGFVGVPEGGDADPVVCFPLLIEFRRFPIPNVAFSVGVARH